MKKVLSKFYLALILMLSTTLILSGKVMAASFGASISKTSLNVGGTATLSVSANNAAGMYKVTISDTSILSISSGSASEFIENGSTKIVLKAKKKGTVKVTATAIDMTDSDNSDKKVTGSKTFTVKVTDSSSSKDDNNVSDKKSNNANLSTLGVTPKEYDFSGFSASKTSYSVTVPNDVNSLNVAYKTADPKAKVTVSGNKDLEVGTNEIKVVVTAEDGKTTKTYTIKVTKLATEDEKPGNIIDDELDLDVYLTALSIEGLQLTPEFKSDVFSYEATIDMDTNDLSSVKVNATANNNEATIEVTGNNNLVEGENLINVIVKGSNSTEQTVYQITVNKISQASEIASSGNLLDKIKNIKREYLIIGGFVFIVLIILIILIVQHIRNKNYYYEEEEEQPEKTNNDNEEEEYTYNPEVHDNFIEELYKRRQNGEELKKEDKETIEDIEKENDRIFNKPKQGETVEYESSDEEDESEVEENTEDLDNKRKKGKHF